MFKINRTCSLLFETDKVDVGFKMSIFLKRQTTRQIRFDFPISFDDSSRPVCGKAFRGDG